MNSKYSFNINKRTLLADTFTPINIYLKARDKYFNSVLLESADYHSQENSYSFICLKPRAGLIFTKESFKINYPNGSEVIKNIDKDNSAQTIISDFINCFNPINKNELSGIIGHFNYDSIRLFENIDLPHSQIIPDINLNFYQYIISFNHFKNELIIYEYLFDNEKSTMDDIIDLIYKNVAPKFKFDIVGNEVSEISDDEYKNYVRKGKNYSSFGEVFQVVLSRQYKQKFKGDDFNVYRALRSINPSPYLFYFDYGNYHLFGSSPEAQLIIKNNKAYINPIAGTVLRTGKEKEDSISAQQLINDPKEKAEHTMLVDLGRNDLSKNCNNVKVKSFAEIHYYSHVIHLVSSIVGEIKDKTNIIKVLFDSFPAGTLSGAPKYRAMEIIKETENSSRGFYGGCIGFIGFNGNLNQAIMIRSFLSVDNELTYRAGAGIVEQSDVNNEFAEINNKLGALRKAIEVAENIN